MAKRKSDLTKEEESELGTISIQLQRKYGSLKEVIEKYGGPSVLLLEGGIINVKHSVQRLTIQHSLQVPLLWYSILRSPR